MTVIAELVLDLSNSDEKVIVRLFLPEVQPDKETWICKYEIGNPINTSIGIHGSTSLQALSLAIKGLSAELYSSYEYKNSELGIFGKFGGYLTVPAPQVLLDIAPYPF
jgi:hypothetical protein